MHDLFNASATGFGRWKQCNNCGATFHNKLWWLAGYKSKTEPPCPKSLSELEYKQWINGAIEAQFE